MKFKIGDKVKCVKNNCVAQISKQDNGETSVFINYNTLSIGQTGTIVSGKSDVGLAVKLDTPIYSGTYRTNISELQNVLNFKNIEIGSIVLLRKGSQAIALCQIISNNFIDENIADNLPSAIS